MEEFDIGYTVNGLVVNLEERTRHGVIDFIMLFKKADPAVVTIILKYGMQVGRWEIARDFMIRTAMYAVPAGEGDFRVEPFSLPDGAHLDMTHPSLLFIFRATDPGTGERYTTNVLVRHDIVKQFVEKTIATVPRSMESMTYDIDDVLRRLLENDQDGSPNPG